MCSLDAQYFQELSPDARKMQNARRARWAGPAWGKRIADLDYQGTREGCACGIEDLR